MGRHTQQEEEMAMTGGGTSSAIVPKEEQAGVDMIPHDGNPADGRDLGAAENMIDTARAGKAQVARNDQHKGKTQTAAQRKQGRSRLRQGPTGHPRATRSFNGPGQRGWDRRERGASSERSGPNSTQDGQTEGGCISGERGY